MPSARPLAAALVVASALLAGACGTGAGGGSTGNTAAGRTVTVFAAASLKKSFTELGSEFEKARPGAHVTFSFAGSSDLVTQLDQGAPADVLATADRRTMARAVDGHLVQGTPRVVATNTLVIITPPDDPQHVSGLADLTRQGVQVVVCALPVPCGAATRAATAAAHVDLHPVSEEQSVTDVLGKVVAGQADAGVVYATDARAAGRAVRTVPLAGASGAVNRYPIAVSATTKDHDDAQAFVDLVAGPAGQAALRRAGFGRP